MDYVRFGNSGMRVSRYCLGCMEFPNRLDEEGARQVVHGALDAGINFFDTANSYGASEEVLGRLLQGKRHEVIVATKFWARQGPRPNERGCSRVHLMQALETSLKRLRTDYVDLYQLHHPDADTPVEETLSTLDALVKQGKVRYIGVSNHYAWQIAHMLGVSALHDWEPVVSLQCRYNICDRAIENETIHFTQRFNIAVMAYGPLARGILTGKYRRGEPVPEGTAAARFDFVRRDLTDELFDLLDVLGEIAAKYGCKLHQLAIAWILSKPFVTTPILGGWRPEHFRDLYEAYALKVAPEDIERIDALSLRYRYRDFHNQRVVQGAPPAFNRW